MKLSQETPKCACLANGAGLSADPVPELLWLGMLLHEIQVPGPNLPRTSTPHLNHSEIMSHDTEFSCSSNEGLSWQPKPTKNLPRRPKALRAPHRLKMDITRPNKKRQETKANK